LLPTNFPPWEAVSKQARRWLEAGVVETMARDYERLPETVAGLHFLAFACLLLHRLMPLIAESA
jgi:transposase